MRGHHVLLIDQTEGIACAPPVIDCRSGTSTATRSQALEPIICKTLKGIDESNRARKDLLNPE